MVSIREAAYRVPVERIAAWRKNPTAYDFTYLWTVHSQFYFWRDYGQALGANSCRQCSLTPRADSKFVNLTPCYMNIINPLDVGFGEGLWENATLTLVKYFNSTNPQVHSHKSCTC